MENNLLTISNLTIAAEKKVLVRNVSLSIKAGEVHALMGPNGSGKSTLANTLAGNPAYTVQSGSVSFVGHDITNASPDKRAKHGLFLSFQHPQTIAGVSVFTFLKEARRALTGADCSVDEFYDQLCKACERLKLDESLVYRNVNEGFSGGQKKQFELLQLLMLKPQLAVLDELDSGLDVDALKSVAHGLQYARRQNPHLGFLIITHYQRILEYIHPDFVHVMASGQLTKSGGAALAHEIDEKGYEQ